MRRISFCFLFLLVFLPISCLKKKEISSDAILTMVEEKRWTELEKKLGNLKSYDLNSSFLYVYCLKKLEKFDKALEIYEKKISNHPNQYFKLLKAELYYETKKINQAKKTLLEIIEEPNPPHEALKLFLRIKYQELQGNLKKFLRIPQINKLLSYQNDLSVLNILSLRELLINSDSKKGLFYLYKAINLGRKEPAYAAVILNFAIIADKYLQKTQTAKTFYKLFLKNNFGTKEQQNLVKQRLMSL